MAVEPGLQAELDSANGTAKTGTAYHCTVIVGTRTVTWISTTKANLRDTLTVAVNQTNFVEAHIKVVSV